MKRDWLAPAVVYRCFDADGQLLYIGSTTNVIRRMQQHRDKLRPDWVDSVVELRTEPYVTYRAAFAAEYAAIRTENSLHNRLGAPTRASA